MIRIVVKGWCYVWGAITAFTLGEYVYRWARAEWDLLGDTLGTR